MINVINKTCEANGCMLRPCFNVPGESKGRFCSQHKQPNMIDVKNKACEADGCMSYPCFNISGETKGRFCFQHKQPNMIDVKNKTCEEDGCTVRPNFNIIGESKGRFCFDHKEPNMIDVIHKTCEKDGCMSRPSYGFPGQAPSYCAIHKKEGTMVHSKKRCLECKNWSTHGITKPVRCEDHALHDDDNLVERKCKNCGFLNILNKEGHCGDCCHWFGKRPRLAKQREVVQFLDAQMADFPYTSVDKNVIDIRDCGGKERPDVLWDLPDRIVILEVDEDQHAGRPCECEQVRMMNISQALGCERTIWIRYNPDAFKSNESKKWSSAHKRHLFLKQWLKWSFSVDLTTLSAISVIHLFFDDFSESNVKVEELL